MKVNLTNHATIRLLQRTIDVSKAKSTVKSPTWKGKGQDGKLLARRTFEDGRTLEVVYVQQRTEATIVTAYYL